MTTTQDLPNNVVPHEGDTDEGRTVSMLGTPTGTLILRVEGAGYDGQELHLRSAKCSVGSAESCTLRLQGDRIADMHCLILRGSGGTVVRSWARNTRLNGREFVDSSLHVGDELCLGPVRLHVIDLGGETAEHSHWSDWFQSGDDKVQVSLDAAHLASELEAYQELEHDLRRQVAAFEEQISQEHDGRQELNDRLSQSCQETEAARQQAEQLHADIQRLEQQIEATLSAAEQHVAATTPDSDVEAELTQQLSEIVDQWEGEREVWGSERSELKRQIEQLRLEGSRQIDELDEAQEMSNG
jgi:hypothetical protein